MMSAMERIGFATRAILSRRLAHLTGAAACAASLVFWGYILRSPQAQSPVAQAAAAPAADPASVVVAAWLGAGEVRLDARVLGLAQSVDGRAVALVSVNGAPPKAVMAGEMLTEGVVLRSIDVGTVTLERGGSLLRLDVPKREDASGDNGIVRVP